jgi:hypothetical protein
MDVMHARLVAMAAAVRERDAEAAVLRAALAASVEERTALQAQLAQSQQQRSSSSGAASGRGDGPRRQAKVG